MVGLYLTDWFRSYDRAEKSNVRAEKGNTRVKSPTDISADVVNNDEKIEDISRSISWSDRV